MKIYKSNYTDIHCGMRGLTKEALLRVNLTSSGWEYASEMVLKASRVGLRIGEVPVTFYKDREGRFSHHRRAGFWSPWHAGWINLKVMLVFSPDSFLIKPGIFFIALGLIFSIGSLSGVVNFGRYGFFLYTQLLGLTLTVLGFALFQTGILARVNHGLRNGFEKSILKIASYDRCMGISCVLILIGLFLDINFASDIILNNFESAKYSRSGIFGLLLIILGIQSFSFGLMLELQRRIFLRSDNYV
jgi:hypothetical protein